MSWEGTSALEMGCSGRHFCCVCFLTVILLLPLRFFENATSKYVNVFKINADSHQIKISVNVQNS